MHLCEICWFYKLKNIDFNEFKLNDYKCNQSKINNVKNNKIQIINLNDNNNDNNTFQCFLRVPHKENDTFLGCIRCRLGFQN